MGSRYSKYFYPIPKEKLIKRFEKPFEKVASGQSATIIALPHTGRTSHLRFIISQPQVLELFKLNKKNYLIAFVDVDKTTGNYESYVSEIINSISKSNSQIEPAIASRDPYLLNQELFKLVGKITKSKKIILIVTLNAQAIPIISELDNLLVLVQKSASKYPVNILFSIDTEVCRNYKLGHSSSTFKENIFYFSVFDADESKHSLKRIAISKGKHIPKGIFDRPLNFTGGIASLFHTLINLVNNVSTKELREILISSERIQKILKTIKRETVLNKNLTPKLLTEQSLSFINKIEIQESSFASIKLATNPTAQEINLLRFLQKNLQDPVSRDDIAKVLWGKAWKNKYSDWAIDKAISRLRKNIKSPEFKIITVKNLGYQLCKLS